MMKLFKSRSEHVADYQAMQAEVKRLTTLNKDMDRQIRDLLAAHPVTDAQLEDFRLMRQDNDRMKHEMDIVTIYLRTRFPRDFQIGLHGPKGIADIVIHYLSHLKGPEDVKAPA